MKPTPPTLGLYLHIPFCKSKCIYCDFYSLPRSESRMDDYTDALCAHLAETAPFAADHLADTVYFGGGTPSYLGARRLTKILKVILKRFKVARDAEITLEANPDSAGDWKELRALRKCGFNRLSLGCSPPTMPSWRRSAGFTPWPRCPPLWRPPGRQSSKTCPWT